MTIASDQPSLPGEPVRCRCSSCNWPAMAVVGTHCVTGSDCEGTMQPVPNAVGYEIVPGDESQSTDIYTVGPNGQKIDRVVVLHIGISLAARQRIAQSIVEDLTPNMAPLPNDAEKALFLTSGSEIKAIRDYRQRTGRGLKESLDVLRSATDKCYAGG